MFAGNPLEFAAENVGLIRQHWKGVRDGDRESIHEARIATRRVRAALTIVDAKKTERLELCRQLGRMLGAVREVDITQEIFRSLSTRVPAASGAIAAVSRRVERDRQQARRRLVKALDELELKPLIGVRKRPSIIAPSFWKDWRQSVVNETLSRQQALSEAVDRTPAVYMPNRVHRVRIATKKLRYTLEVAEKIGLRVDTTVMRDLRKIQDLLGSIHDVDVARRVVQELDEREPIATELALLDAVMAADCAALHDKYLARRDRIRAVCEYCRHLAAAARRRWSLALAKGTVPAAAGAVAVRVAMSRLAAGIERSHA